MTHRRRLAPIALAAAAALAVAAIALHGYALSLERRARDTSHPASARVAWAHRASAIEPFNRRFKLTVAIITAEELLATGNADAAWRLLNPYAPTTIGDSYFTETYRAVNRKKMLDDARKAHQQHGREKEGGALDPEDVIP